MDSKIKLKKNFLWSLILFFLLFPIFHFELLLNTSDYIKLDFYENLGCIDSKNDILRDQNLKNYEIEFKKNEISIFPETYNLICLGRVSYKNLPNNKFAEFSRKPVLEVYQASSNIFSLFIFLAVIPSLVLFLLKLTKNSRLTFYVLVLSINLTVLNISIIPSNLIYLINISIPFFLMFEIFNYSKTKKIDNLNNFIGNEVSNKRVKFALVIIFFVMYLRVFIDIFNTRYTIGYYFINYNHGLISKGIFGNLFFNLPYSNEVRVFLVNLFISFIYLLIILLTIRVFTTEKQNYISYFLLFSPTFLIFPLNVSFFRISSFGNPEIFGILSFLIFTLFIKNGNKIYYSFAVIIFGVSALSHEVNLFIIIFILFALLEKFNFVTVVKLLFPFLIISILVSFMWISSSELSYEVAGKICDDLESLEIRDNICLGAVSTFTQDYINKGTSYYDNRLHFNWFTSDQLPYTTYIIVYILGLAPLFNYIKEKKYSVYILLSTLLFGFILIKASDWGRFFYLFFSCIYIYYFIKKDKSNKKINFKLLILFFVYVTTWKSAPCCSINLFEIENFIYNFLHIQILNIYFVLRKIKNET